ncbi:MAG: DUF4129 domain-containing protein [Haloarculaceae archaeon]
MKRLATALIALLAVFALASAAGSFEGADGGRITGDATLVERSGSHGGGAAPGAPKGSNGGSAVGSGGSTATAQHTGGGGVSPLFVALLVGALVACGVLAVVLTDDDVRAPRPDEEAPEDGDEQSVPAVSLSYDAPPDNAVIRAWRSLSRATGDDDSRTPEETERVAAERGFPGGAVATVASHFRAVRYGDESVDERRRRAVADAVERLDADARGVETESASGSGSASASGSGSRNGRTGGSDP